MRGAGLGGGGDGHQDGRGQQAGGEQPGRAMTGHRSPRDGPAQGGTYRGVALRTQRGRHHSQVFEYKPIAVAPGGPLE
ncbi:hypothetical protein GCM10023235_09900 [Kitasatospora terrestris]|uniref:Uncharacterized protein n=1 Tax=Kitasatospora terrestris TaxID=258051 RepID=A0ABP9DA61_9ACTN